MRLFFQLIIALVVALVPGLAAAEGKEPPRKKAPTSVQTPESSGIQNFFQLSPSVYSGSTPAKESGFATLARRGVKTIISVDGARPDVDSAKKFGIRTIHLPHGYDGIDPKTQLQLIKGFDLSPGAVFIHCHHGRHRGPAAAALICRARQDWSESEAEQFLHAAGTSTNYAGLYQTVRAFRMPDAAALNSISQNLPETAPVSGLIDAMVEIDDRWDRLKAIRVAGYQAPPDHPDVDPANEAVILWEHFREARRNPEAERLGISFLQQLETAEMQARELEQWLRSFVAKPTAESRARLDKTFAAMEKSCANCHQIQRDPAGIKSGISKPPQN